MIFNKPHRVKKRYKFSIFLCPISDIAQKQKNIEIMGWNSSANHCDTDLDNHANQLNPNNDEYWHSRQQL